MKLSKRQLKKIIKEEYNRVLLEESPLDDLESFAPADASSGSFIEEKLGGALDELQSLLGDPTTSEETKVKIEEIMGMLEEVLDFEGEDTRIDDYEQEMEDMEAEEDMSPLRGPL